MISDTLFDAVAEIEEYQRKMPDAYADVCDEIGVVTTVMDAVP